MKRLLPCALLIGLVFGAGCGSAGTANTVAAQLAALTFSTGAPSPSFSPETTTYTVGVGFVTGSVCLTPVATNAAATIRVDGAPVASGDTTDPIPLAVGPNPILVEVGLAGQAPTTYTVVVTRAPILAQEAYVKASNTDVTDSFGVSVALAADTLVVGAYREDSGAAGVGGNEADNSAANSGAVYVFVRNGSTWSQQAYLKASNAQANDFFGWSVAISGETLVVGAYGEDSSATGANGDQDDDGAGQSGAAYVYTRAGSTWSQQTYLKASNTQANDNFGYAVGISENTLVVAAPGEDSAATSIGGDQNDNTALSAGAAYVFVRTGTAWSQQAYLKASNAEGGDSFGELVAISADTVVVAAPNEASNASGVDGDQADNSAVLAGAAYVFARAGSTWTQQAYLKAADTDARDRFGHAVVGAIREDSSAAGVNGDPTDNTADSSGAAYVFTRTGTTWTADAYLKASNAEGGDQFGSGVAVSGHTVVVTANWEASAATGVDGDQGDNSIPESGAAYVFSRSGGTWSQVAYVKASNPDVTDQLGQVSVSGDTVVLGAFSEDSSATGIDGDQADNSATSAGAVYVLR